MGQVAVGGTRTRTAAAGDGRLVALDGLRGIAALVVVVHTAC